MNKWAPSWVRVLFRGLKPRFSVGRMTLSAASRRRLDEIRRERGLVSVEYLATALIAAALIAILAAVPIATQPTLTSEFTSAVCRIFGGECGGAGSAHGVPEDEPQNPNDEVPECTVSRGESKAEAKGTVVRYHLKGGWALQDEVNSDGKHTLRLTSSYGGGGEVKLKGGKELKAGKHSKSSDKSLNGEVGAELAIGFEQGDTWEVDSDEEAQALRKQLEDWTYYNMLDDASFGLGGKAFSGLTNGPKPPRDPDAKRYTVDVEGEGKAEGNLGFNVNELVEGALGGKIKGDIGGKAGIETKDSGDLDILLERGFGGEAAAKAELKAEPPEPLPGEQKNPASRPANGSVEAGTGLDRKEIITLQYNDKHELTGVKVRQMKGHEGKFKGTGTTDLSGGDKTGPGKERKNDLSAGLNPGREEWYDVEMDFSQMTKDDKDAAVKRLLLNPKPVDLEGMMKNGPGSSDAEQAIYNNSKLSKNVYDVNKSKSEDILDLGFAKGEVNSEDKNHKLIDSEYAEPVKDGRRNIRKNDGCLK